MSPCASTTPPNPHIPLKHSQCCAQLSSTASHLQQCCARDDAPSSTKQSSTYYMTTPSEHRWSKRRKAYWQWSRILFLLLLLLFTAILLTHDWLFTTKDQPSIAEVDNHHHHHHHHQDHQGLSLERLLQDSQHHDFWKRQAPTPSTTLPTPTSPSPTSSPTLGPCPFIDSVGHPACMFRPDRPMVKPSLLTENEFEELWDPDPDKMRLGILLPFNTSTRQRDGKLTRKGLSAIKLAVKHINERKVIPGVQVALVLRDSQTSSLYSTSGGAAISAAARLIGFKVGAVIGDIRSEQTRYEALMTSSINIPQCSYASASTLLSDDDMYPYFFRTIPTAIVLLDAILDVIRFMDWHRITLLYDVRTMGWEAREYFSVQAAKMNIFILDYIPLTVSGDSYDRHFTQPLKRAKTVDSRIQILIAAGEMQEDLLYAAREAGMMTSEYAWVTSNDISSVFLNDHRRRDFDGLIMIDNGWNLRGYEPYDEFFEEWMTLDKSEYPGAGDPTLTDNEAMAYSCAMMIAKAYGTYMRQHGTINGDQLNTTTANAIIQGDLAHEMKMTEYFTNVEYLSPSGPITLDENGDRKEGYYVATSLQNGVPYTFGLILTTNYSAYTRPLFKNGSIIPPKDAPLWALQNPTWTNPGGIVLGTICILMIGTTFVFMILVIRYRNHVIIKASSPTFCICELVGILLVLIWCVLYVGIPTESVCLAQSFLLPLGITLLVGSLTVKNYRIYRIFNSVGFSNEVFQTRLLMRYVFGAVALCLIPKIFQVILDKPVPRTLNIRQYQWIQCESVRRIEWFVASAVLPFVLVLFGVYLAFRTRNVVFLWNEARQIALVLYNIFFFTIIILISQTFPYEIYPATFYISFVGTFFTTTMSLWILFLPKFWDLWKQHRKSVWEFSTGGPLSEGGIGGNRPTPQLTGVAGGTLPTYGLFGGGGIGGGGENLGGVGINGDQLMSRKNSLVVWTNDLFRRRSPCRTNPSRGTPSSPVYPDDLDHAEHQQQQHPSDAQLDQDPLRENQNEHSNHTPGSRRLSIIGAVSGGVTVADENLQAGGRSDRELFLIRMQNLSHPDLSVAAEGRTSRELVTSDSPLQRTFTEESAAPVLRMLESYVFLLPIMTRRNRISNFLSHWAMATIILTPEAHAFLAVDSTTGKSRSILMKSMFPIYNEHEPTLRVEAVRSGTLLIRFPSLGRLKGWMGLFSQQDLQILSALDYEAASRLSPDFLVPDNFAPIHAGRARGDTGADGATIAGGGGEGTASDTTIPVASGVKWEPSSFDTAGDAHTHRGLTKVEVSLEEQLEGVEPIPPTSPTSPPRNTSFVSRVGSSISSGTSRIWSMRRNSTGSFWGTRTCRNRGSQESTTPTPTHRMTQISGTGIGPLDHPRSPSDSWASSSYELATYSTSTPIPNLIASKTAEDEQRGTSNECKPGQGTATLPRNNSSGWMTRSADSYMTCIPEHHTTPPRRWSKAGILTSPPSVVQELEEGSGTEEEGEGEQKGWTDKEEDISVQAFEQDPTVHMPPELLLLAEASTASSSRDSPSQALFVSHKDGLKRAQGDATAAAARRSRSSTSPPSLMGHPRPNTTMTTAKIEPNISPSATLVPSSESIIDGLTDVSVSPCSGGGCGGGGEGTGHSSITTAPTTTTSTTSEQRKSSASTSLTPSSSQCPSSSLYAAIEGRPHLIEVLNAIGMDRDLYNPDDDSEDDLYDPEFGIGPGSGRRRRIRRRRGVTRVLDGGGGSSQGNNSPQITIRDTNPRDLVEGGGGGGGNLEVQTKSSPTNNIRVSSSRNSSVANTPDDSLRPIARIPSQAVLSVAAAAVSAGWHEGDALAVAIAMDEKKKQNQSRQSTPAVSPASSSTGVHTSTPAGLSFATGRSKRASGVSDLSYSPR